MIETDSKPFCGFTSENDKCIPGFSFALSARTGALQFFETIFDLLGTPLEIWKLTKRTLSYGSGCCGMECETAAVTTCS